MIFKILMLLLVAAGLIYWIKQPRGGTPYSPYPTARPRRPVFIAPSMRAASRPNATSGCQPAGSPNMRSTIAAATASIATIGSDSISMTALRP